jgi:ABC transporter substrate binding protein
VKRRAFITLLGGAAAWPLAARAQQPTRKIVKLGFLQAFRNENTVAFVQGLRSAGYIEGQNALVEARFYGSMPDRTLELANELVSLQCDVIIATGPHAIQAAMSATSVLPIVGVDLESDPVAKGWATSLARPGKNLTGWFLDLPELGGKQIELLIRRRARPLAPQATCKAIIIGREPRRCIRRRAIWRAFSPPTSANYRLIARCKRRCRMRSAAFFR